MGKIWRDFGHAFSFASSSSRGMYPSPSYLPLYEKQLRDAESGIQNMLNAIQAGILTSSTKERLEQLEETKREFEARIAEEKLAKPKIKEEFIRFNRKGRFGILF